MWTTLKVLKFERDDSFQVRSNLHLGSTRWSHSAGNSEELLWTISLSRWITWKLWLCLRTFHLIHDPNSWWSQAQLGENQVTCVWRFHENKKWNRKINCTLLFYICTRCRTSQRLFTAELWFRVTHHEWDQLKDETLIKY